MWEIDILTIGAPIRIPQITSSVSLNSCDSGVGFNVTLGANMYLAATLSLTVEKIKLFGSKIFEGYEWTPDEELLRFKICSMTPLTIMIMIQIVI